jgi:hypothetical protein
LGGDRPRYSSCGRRYFIAPFLVFAPQENGESRHLTQLWRGKGEVIDAGRRRYILEIVHSRPWSQAAAWMAGILGLPPAFSAPPRLPVPLSCIHQPGSTPALSTLGGALGLHALDRGDDQGDRRSALKSAVQLGQLALGGPQGQLGLRRVHPPRWCRDRRRGSNPLGSLTPSSSSSSSTAAATATSSSSLTLCSTLFP